MNIIPETFRAHYIRFLRFSRIFLIYYLLELSIEYQCHFNLRWIDNYHI